MKKEVVIAEGKSARRLLVRVFIKLFVVTYTLVFIFGAVAAFYYALSIQDKYIEKITNVVELHRVEFLNEMALKDKESLKDHIGILRRDLDVDGVELYFEGHRFKSSSSFSNSSFLDGIAQAIGVEPLIFDIANEFEDVTATLTVRYDQAMLKHVVLPVYLSSSVISVISLLPIAISFLLLYGKIRIRLLDPLAEITQSMMERSDSEGVSVEAKNQFDLQEIVSLRTSSLRYKEYKAEALRAEIAAMVAHDIRSPLSALRIVASKSYFASAGHKELFDSAINRIREIADDLLYTGIEKLLPKTSLGGKLVLPCVQMVVNEKQIEYSSSAKVQIFLSNPNDSIKAYFDEKAFKRILSNVLNNAIEAVGGDGVIRVSLFRDDIYCIISIQDNGSGIDPENIASLGVKGASFGKKDGKGLGLYSAMRTLEQWEGKLVIESKKDVGTTVRMVLRILEDSKQSEKV